MAKILIIGCGYIGTHLAKKCAAEGFDVWGLKRNARSLPLPIKPIGVDVLELTDAHLPQDLDYIFYMISPDSYTDEAYRTAYELGMRNLLFALGKGQQNPIRIILVSSTGVYSQSNGEWVDEMSEVRPNDFAGQRVLNCESMLLDSLFASTIVRFGGIYGPMRTSLINRVKSGEAKLDLPGHSHYTNRIHLVDCVNSLYHLMQLPNPESLYLAVDSEPSLRNTVLEWIAEQLHVKLAVAVKPETASSHQRHLSNKRCRNAKLLASGYQFTYPTFRDGYEELIRSLVPV